MAQDGVVYLDTQRPRVCIRGPEDRSKADLGYPWLSEDQVFPFFELRAAAQGLRDGAEFDPDDARRRIAAQLNTLCNHRIRHVVFGAFGCGVFRNPAHRVAQIYREEIARCKGDFSVIAFAIFSAGYRVGSIWAARGGSGLEMVKCDLVNQGRSGSDCGWSHSCRMAGRSLSGLDGESWRTATRGKLQRNVFERWGGKRKLFLALPWC